MRLFFCLGLNSAHFAGVNIAAGNEETTAASPEKKDGQEVVAEKKWKRYAARAPSFVGLIRSKSLGHNLLKNTRSCKLF